MKPMEALGPKARALIDSGRAAYRPQSGDRERIEAALRARLGAQALPRDAAIGGAQRPWLRRWPVLSGAAVGIGVTAMLVLRSWSSPDADARPTQPKPAQADLPLAQPTPVSPPPLAPPDPVPVQDASSTPARTASPPNTLAQEVALLARATREIGLGKPLKALKALDDHARRFPNGLLREERRSARAQALCALGRIEEGRAEQAALAPRSPTAARAGQACDAAARSQAEARAR